MMYLDCNTSVGLPCLPALWAEYTPEALERQMDLCGVDACFAWHRAALDCHPLSADEEILRVRDAHPRIRPVFVLLPSQTGEFMEPDRLTDWMRREEVRVARLFPGDGAHRFSLEEWQSGPLFSALEEAGIPAMVDAAQADWDSLRGVCLRHPKLSVIVANMHYRELRKATAALLATPNLCLETGGLKSFGALDALCGFGLSGRLLFGSGAMEASMGAGAAIVRLSGAGEDLKAGIASGNLLKLCAGGEKR